MILVKRISKLIFGFLGILIGSSIVLWALYNTVIESQPAFERSVDGPAWYQYLRLISGSLFAFMMIAIGYEWFTDSLKKNNHPKV